jgi:hypothetical protein
MSSTTADFEGRNIGLELILLGRGFITVDIGRTTIGLVYHSPTNELGTSKFPGHWQRQINRNHQPGRGTAKSLEFYNDPRDETFQYGDEHR